MRQVGAGSFVIRIVRAFFIAAYILAAVPAFADNLTPAAPKTSLEAQYERVLEMERQVLILREGLVRDQFRAADFMERVATPLENSAGDFGIEAYLKNWEVRVHELHGVRYQLIEKRHHLITLLVHFTLQQWARSKLGDAELAPHEQERLRSEFQKIEKLFLKWSSSSDEVGEGVNPKLQKERVYTFTKYFDSVRVLLTHFRQAPEPRSFFSGTSAERASGIARVGVSGTNLLVQTLGRTLFHFLNLANPIHYAAPSLETALSSALLKNKTPFTTLGGFTSLMKGLGDTWGFQVAVSGRENLKDIPLDGIDGQKVVNLFLPAHRSALVDAILMSHLDLPHFLIFANPKAIVGNVIPATLIGSLPEFIAVGKWRGFPALKPTEKLMRALEGGRSPNVINYPQGFVSNAGEFLPINANFVKSLLVPLLSEGYQVNIIPVSYEVDTAFASQSDSVDHPEVEARFHPPLFSRAVTSLVARQMAFMREATQLQGEAKIAQGRPSGRIIDHFMSLLWLESTKSGELGIDEMIGRIEGNLGLNLRSGGFLPAVLKN